MDVRSEEERDAYRAFVKGVNEVLLCECHRRCPNNNGHEPRCEYCDVQHILNLVSSCGKIKSERMGSYMALKWLINNPHQYEYLEEQD